MVHKSQGLNVGMSKRVKVINKKSSIKAKEEDRITLKVIRKGPHKKVRSWIIKQGYLENEEIKYANPEEFH